MIELNKIPLAKESLDQSFLDSWIHDFGACTLSAADEVGIFIALSDHGKSAEQIASLLRLDPHFTLVVCKSLVALDALELRNGIFELSPFSRTFWVKHTPTYRGKEFDRHRDWEQHQRIVDTLDGKWAPIHDGESSFTNVWQKGNLSPKPALAFTKVMHSLTFMPSLAASRSQAFQNLEHVVDVAGGSGAFCAALAAHHADIRVTLMELPPVCEASKQILQNIHSRSRIEYYPCNVFQDPWPEDADAFYFSNVLHDWPLSTCKTLLSLARHALKPGGSVFIHEALLDPDGIFPRTISLFNQLMFMNHRGQQFTRAQLFSLLDEVGMLPASVVHHYSYWHLTQARKP